MATQEQKIESYNEAKKICEQYKYYKGDKRRFAYKHLQRIVLGCFMDRMNSFGKMTNNPGFQEYFYGDK